MSCLGQSLSQTVRAYGYSVPGATFGPAPYEAISVVFEEPGGLSLTEFSPYCRVMRSC